MLINIIVTTFYSKFSNFIFYFEVLKHYRKMVYLEI